MLDVWSFTFYLLAVLTAFFGIGEIQDRTKRWILYFLFFAGIFGYGIVENYQGQQEGRCEIYETAVSQGHMDVEDIPEYCDDY